MSASEDSVAKQTLAGTNEMVGTDKTMADSGNQTSVADSVRGDTVTPQDPNGYFSDSNNSASSGEGIDGAFTDPATLKIRLKAQLEYYFSQKNLQTDQFLNSKRDAEGYVPISVIADFKKVTKLTKDHAKIIEAIEDSAICSLNADKTAIKEAWKKPERNTIIIREVNEETTEQDILDLCKAELKGLEVVSVREDLNIWFVEMKNEEDARNAILMLAQATFQGKNVRCRIKTESAQRFAPAFNYNMGPSQMYQGNGMGSNVSYGYNSYPQFNGIMPGYAGTGQWDPAMYQQQGQEWTPEGSNFSQGRSPRGTSNSGRANNQKRNAGNKNKGNQSGGKNSGKGGKNNQSSGNASSTNASNSNNASGKSKKSEKSGANNGSGRKKKSGANAASQNNSSQPKKLKTPVFQPQDFPSLPMGKISLEGELETVEESQKETLATSANKSAAAVVAATNAPTVADVVAKPDETPENTVVEPKEEAVAETKPEENKVVAAVVEGDVHASPTPSQPEQEANPLPSSGKQSKSASGASWAAAVAKAPRVQTPAVAVSAPKTETKSSKKSKAKSASPAETKKTAVPAVAPVVPAPASEAAAPTGPRPRRGWEKPGVAPVVPMEKPKPQPTASATKKESSKSSKKVKKSKVRAEPESVVVESVVDVIETEQVADAVQVEPKKGVWGAKSFVDVIKENKEKQLLAGMDEVESDVNGDKSNFAEFGEGLKSDARRGNFFNASGDGVGNLDKLNWREQAKNRREQEEARKRNK